jgi:hypothetical protein
MFEFVLSLAALGLLQPRADGGWGLTACKPVEHLLIALGALHHTFGAFVDGQYQGSLQPV